MTSRALGFFSFGRRATQDHADALRDLELLFPAVDRLWLSALVSKFDDGLADRASIVDEVAQKIMYVYHGWYPTTSKDPLSVSSKNAYLVALHQRFPNVQLSFLRSCILSTKYNHIQHITEKILDMERRSEPYPKSPDPQELTPSDLFRPLDYIEVFLILNILSTEY